MEEQGGDGTRFSHWDARIMHTEVRCARQRGPRPAVWWGPVHGGLLSVRSLRSYAMLLAPIISSVLAPFVAMASKLLAMAST